MYASLLVFFSTFALADAPSFQRLQGQYLEANSEISLQPFRESEFVLSGSCRIGKTDDERIGLLLTHYDNVQEEVNAEFKVLQAWPEPLLSTPLEVWIEGIHKLSQPVSKKRYSPVQERPQSRSLYFSRYLSIKQYLSPNRFKEIIPSVVDRNRLTDEYLLKRNSKNPLPLLLESRCRSPKGCHIGTNRFNADEPTLYCELTEEKFRRSP